MGKWVMALRPASWGGLRRDARSGTALRAYMVAVGARKKAGVNIRVQGVG